MSDAGGGGGGSGMNEFESLVEDIGSKLRGLASLAEKSEEALNRLANVESTKKLSDELTASSAALSKFVAALNTAGRNGGKGTATMQAGIENINRTLAGLDTRKLGQLNKALEAQQRLMQAIVGLSREQKEIISNTIRVANESQSAVVSMLTGLKNASSEVKDLGEEIKKALAAFNFDSAITNIDRMVTKLNDLKPNNFQQAAAAFTEMRDAINSMSMSRLSQLNALSSRMSRRSSGTYGAADTQEVQQPAKRKYTRSKPVSSGDLVEEVVLGSAKAEKVLAGIPQPTAPDPKVIAGKLKERLARMAEHPSAPSSSESVSKLFGDVERLEKEITAAIDSTLTEKIRRRLATAKTEALKAGSKIEDADQAVVTALSAVDLNKIIEGLIMGAVTGNAKLLETAKINLPHTFIDKIVKAYSDELALIDVGLSKRFTDMLAPASQAAAKTEPTTVAPAVTDKPVPTPVSAPAVQATGTDELTTVSDIEAKIRELRATEQRLAKQRTQLKDTIEQAASATSSDQSLRKLLAQAYVDKVTPTTANATKPEQERRQLDVAKNATILTQASLPGYSTQMHESSLKQVKRYIDGFEELMERVAIALSLPDAKDQTKMLTATLKGLGLELADVELPLSRIREDTARQTSSDADGFAEALSVVDSQLLSTVDELDEVQFALKSAATKLSEMKKVAAATAAAEASAQSKSATSAATAVINPVDPSSLKASRSVNTSLESGSGKFGAAAGSFGGNILSVLMGGLSDLWMALKNFPDHLMSMADKIAIAINAANDALLKAMESSPFELAGKKIKEFSDVLKSAVDNLYGVGKSSVDAATAMAKGINQAHEMMTKLAGQNYAASVAKMLGRAILYGGEGAASSLSPDPAEWGDARTGHLTSRGNGTGTYVANSEGMELSPAEKAAINHQAVAAAVAASKHGIAFVRNSGLGEQGLGHSSVAVRDSEDPKGYKIRQFLVDTKSGVTVNQDEQNSPRRSVLSNANYLEATALNHGTQEDAQRFLDQLTETTKEGIKYGFSEGGGGLTCSSAVVKAANVSGLIPADTLPAAVGGFNTATPESVIKAIELGNRAEAGIVETSPDPLAKTPVSRETVNAVSSAAVLDKVKEQYTAILAKLATAGDDAFKDMAGTLGATITDMSKSLSTSMATLRNAPDDVVKSFTEMQEKIAKLNSIIGEVNKYLAFMNQGSNEVASTIANARQHSLSEIKEIVERAQNSNNPDYKIEPVVAPEGVDPKAPKSHVGSTGIRYDDFGADQSVASYRERNRQHIEEAVNNSPTGAALITTGGSPHFGSMYHEFEDGVKLALDHALIAIKDSVTGQLRLLELSPGGDYDVAGNPTESAMLASRAGDKRNVDEMHYRLMASTPIPMPAEPAQLDKMLAETANVQSPGSVYSFASAVGETCSSSIAQGIRKSGLDPNFGKPVAGVNTVTPARLLEFFAEGKYQPSKINAKEDSEKFRSTLSQLETKFEAIFREVYGSFHRDDVANVIMGKSSGDESIDRAIKGRLRENALTEAGPDQMRSYLVTRDIMERYLERLSRMQKDAPAPESMGMAAVVSDVLQKAEAGLAEGLSLIKPSLFSDLMKSFDELKATLSGVRLEAFSSALDQAILSLHSFPGVEGMIKDYTASLKDIDSTGLKAARFSIPRGTPLADRKTTNFAENAVNSFQKGYATFTFFNSQLGAAIKGVSEFITASKEINTGTIVDMAGALLKIGGAFQNSIYKVTNGLGIGGRNDQNKPLFSGMAVKGRGDTLLSFLDAGMRLWGKDLGIPAASKDTAKRSPRQTLTPEDIAERERARQDERDAAAARRKAEKERIIAESRPKLQTQTEIAEYVVTGWANKRFGKMAVENDPAKASARRATVSNLVMDRGINPNSVNFTDFWATLTDDIRMNLPRNADMLELAYYRELERNMKWMTDNQKARFAQLKAVVASSPDLTKEYSDFQAYLNNKNVEEFEKRKAAANQDPGIKAQRLATASSIGYYTKEMRGGVDIPGSRGEPVKEESIRASLHALYAQIVEEIEAAKKIHLAVNSSSSDVLFANSVDSATGLKAQLADPRDMGTGNTAFERFIGAFSDTELAQIKKAESLLADLGKGTGIEGVLKKGGYAVVSEQSLLRAFTAAFGEESLAVKHLQSIIKQGATGVSFNVDGKSLGASFVSSNGPDSFTPGETALHEVTHATVKQMGEVDFKKATSIAEAVGSSRRADYKDAESIKAIIDDANASTGGNLKLKINTLVQDLDYLFDPEEMLAYVGQAILTGSQDVEQLFRKLYGEQAFDAIKSSLEETAPSIFKGEGLAGIRNKFSEFDTKFKGIVATGLTEGTSEQATGDSTQKITPEQVRQNIDDAASYVQNLVTKLDFTKLERALGELQSDPAIGGIASAVAKSLHESGTLFEHLAEDAVMSSEVRTAFVDMIKNPTANAFNSLAGRLGSLIQGRIKEDLGVSQGGLVGAIQGAQYSSTLKTRRVADTVNDSLIRYAGAAVGRDYLPEQRYRYFDDFSSTFKKKTGESLLKDGFQVSESFDMDTGLTKLTASARTPKPQNPKTPIF